MIVSFDGQPFGGPEIARPVVALLGPSATSIVSVYAEWRPAAARALEPRVGTVVLPTRVSWVRSKQLYASWLASWLYESDVIAAWMQDVDPMDAAWPMFELGLSVGLARTKPFVVGAEPCGRSDILEIMIGQFGSVLGTPQICRSLEDVLAATEVALTLLEGVPSRWPNR